MTHSGQRTQGITPIFWTMILSAILGLFFVRDARAEFVPIDPCRLLDTRSPGEGPTLVGQTTREVVVRGLCGIPESATAINFNATIIASGGPGYLTLHPAGTALPVVSSLNFVAGDVRGNAGVVKLGSTEPSLSAYLATAPAGRTAHLILDVTGYHAGTIVGATARANGHPVLFRYENNYDGTVTDRLTGLQWEIKTGDGVHDIDNFYTWSTSLSPELPNGTVHTEFLAELNETEFAGHDDWRLPTVLELQSIALHGSQCDEPPCTRFRPGGTASDIYLAGDENTVSMWAIDFETGGVVSVPKTQSHRVRAVRGGWAP